MRCVFTCFALAVSMYGSTLSGGPDNVGIDSAITADGSWHEFAFGMAGSFASSCGGFCTPTIDPVAEQVSSSPWTFTGPGEVTIADLFQRGDRFELFDLGLPLGLTSVPVNDGAVTCPSAGVGNDILACLANPTYSHGSFMLGGGPHSLTIEVTQNAVNASGGAAAFQVAPVPEPRTLVLLSVGFLALGRLRQRR